MRLRGKFRGCPRLSWAGPACTMVRAAAAALRVATSGRRMMMLPVAQVLVDRIAESYRVSASIGYPHAMQAPTRRKNKMRACPRAAGTTALEKRCKPRGDLAAEACMNVCVGPRGKPHGISLLKLCKICGSGLRLRGVRRPQDLGSAAVERLIEAAWSRLA